MAVKMDQHVTPPLKTEDNDQPKANKRDWGGKKKGGGFGKGGGGQGKGGGAGGQTGGGHSKEVDGKREGGGKKGKGKDEDYEWSTIKVGNVPLNTHRRNVESLMAAYGAVKKCWVLKARPGADSTIGFVTFRSAKEAIEVVNLSLQMKDNPLQLSLVPNTKIDERLRGDGKKNDGNTGKSSETGKSGNKSIGGNRQQQKQQSNAKKSRLILRNLSFKATEEGMREHFGKYGELVEVHILKKADGQMVGCAFIQYKNKNHAVKAIKEMNGKKFLGRPVAVDWAVPKEVFKGAVVQEIKDEEIKDEEIKDEPLEIKEEEELDETDVKIVDDVAPKPKRQKILKEEIKEEDDSDNEDDNEENDDDDSGNDSEGEAGDHENKPPQPSGHDVDERKTVFIKNLSFDSEEDDLHDMMEEVFGPVFFARFVMNKEMNHSKGTAFVKFKNVEDAEECVRIAAGPDGLFLDKRQLDVKFAIKKDDVKVAVSERKKKDSKDNRNLYLANEGLIREGTKAAQGVSATDMSMRRFLLRQKKEILQNLHMFVSTTRLVVRNLPFTMNDRMLKKMFEKHSPENARILEARIMKTSSISDTSKGFAFVNFSKHEDALAALRNMNNNPEIFGPNHRPIIDFSIEDRKALNARARRAEMSKLKNPTYVAKYGDKLSNPNIRPLGQGKIDSSSLPMLKKGETKDVGTEDFGGSVAKPNMKNLPKHLGSKERERNKSLKISRNKMKKGQRDMKNPSKRKRLAALKRDDREQQAKQAAAEVVVNPAKKMRKEKMKMSKAARKEKMADKSFDRLVDKYKKDLVPDQKVLKKWFD